MALAYFTMHDVLVHRRLPPPFTPRSGYLAHLVAAHHLHHAVHTQGRGGVVRLPLRAAAARLRAQLRALNRPPASQD